MFCSWGADAIPQTADVAGGVFRVADRARLHVGSCIQASVVARGNLNIADVGSWPQAAYPKSRCEKEKERFECGADARQERPLMTVRPEGANHQ